MKQAIQLEGAAKPIGPYSPVIKAGNMIFVSGQIPADPITRELKIENIEVATRQVLDNIKQLLVAAGATLDHVVKCQVFLKDMNDFQAMNAIYAEYFNNVPPAREAVQVAKLPSDVNIEISCIAMLD
jgi:2-iminobutanoate/2-iminopropanoate deaminase